MGRPKKEPPKRVSGTGYTQAEARTLKYSRLSEDGKTYEVDIATIKAIIDRYTDRENRVRTREIANTKTGTVSAIKETAPISEAGLMKALGISKRETYNTWLQGYVNPKHIDDLQYAANDALSETLHAGKREVEIYLSEDAPYQRTSLTIRELESMGALTPQKQVVDHNIRTGKWGKWGK